MSKISKLSLIVALTTGALVSTVAAANPLGRFPLLSQLRQPAPEVMSSNDDVAGLNRVQTSAKVIVPPMTERTAPGSRTAVH